MARVRLALVLLLLGVVSTVAAAWGLAWDVHESRRPMQCAKAGLSGSGERIGVWRRDSWGGVAIVARVGEQLVTEEEVKLEEVLPRWAEGELLGWLRPPARPTHLARAAVGTGWPFVSLWSGYELVPSAGYWWYKARDGIVVGDAPAAPLPRALLSPRERVLPVRTVWGGFLLSAVFWSCAWGAVVVGPRVVRRAVRRRRGLCVGCGYDRKGLGVCPECGK